MRFFSELEKLVIKFLGTLGYVEEEGRKEKHKCFAGVLFSFRGKKLLVDCGERKFLEEKPDFILISHAHPDHMQGLKEGTDIPVYCSRAAEKTLSKFDLNLQIFDMEDKFGLDSFKIETFPVTHSIREENVGIIVRVPYRKVGYFSDVLSIPKYKERLKDLDLYIGDGSFLYRTMVRRKEEDESVLVFGHASVKDQVKWCGKAGVKKAIFTHLGDEALRMREDSLRSLLREWGEEFDLEVDVAFDGKLVIL